jgi:putative endonuclease
MLRILLKLFSRGRDEDNTGAASEWLAAEWLVHNRGFSVVARNWRNPRDRREEIDLVCREGEVLVFVEVKARAAEALVPGYYAVDQRKKKVLLRATKAYIARLREKPSTFRLDVVEVQLPAEPGGEPTVRHFENVPLFPKYYRG